MGLLWRIIQPGIEKYCLGKGETAAACHSGVSFGYFAKPVWCTGCLRPASAFCFLFRFTCFPRLWVSGKAAMSPDTVQEAGMFLCILTKQVWLSIDHHNLRHTLTAPQSGSQADPVVNESLFVLLDILLAFFFLFNLNKKSPLIFISNRAFKTEGPSLYLLKVHNLQLLWIAVCLQVSWQLKWQRQCVCVGIMLICAGFIVRLQSVGKSQYRCHISFPSDSSFPFGYLSDDGGTLNLSPLKRERWELTESLTNEGS